MIDIDEKIWDKEFLCKFLQAKAAFLNSKARGATIKGIKIDDLANLMIPHVSLDQQHIIVTILNCVLDVIESRKKQLQAFDTLIKARFVEMFGDPEYNYKEWPIKKLSDLCNVGSSKRVYQEKQTMDGLQAGSTVAYLSIAMLKKMNVMLPDRKLQEQFASFVSQVNKSKAVAQEALDKAQLLFDSLMQQYFD